MLLRCHKLVRFLVTTGETGEEGRDLPTGPIVFDIEQIDTKNSFNITDGVFTVPESGLYLFTFNGLIKSNIVGEVYVYVNGKMLKDFFDKEDAQFGRQLTFFFSMELQQNDELYLYNYYFSLFYS